MKTIKVIISGKVQGVGYRSWTVKNAKKLGLAGWVRNLSNGDVEALFQGKAASVDHMIELCRKGPISAAVENIRTAAAELFVGKDFRELPTE